jgi:hypothetical protein
MGRALRPQRASSGHKRRRGHCDACVADAKGGPMPALPSRSALLVVLAIAGCHKPPPPPQSLVGDFPVPGAYVLAGDTITAWQRVRQPDGASRFQSYSITPGGTVEYLDEPEHGEAAPGEEQVAQPGEQRKAFALPLTEFAAIRGKAALLRPSSLGPRNPIGGYGGEVVPRGCALDDDGPRLAGITFLNDANWGVFVLQDGCASPAATQAGAALADIFGRLERAGRMVEIKP